MNDLFVAQIQELTNVWLEDMYTRGCLPHIRVDLTGEYAAYGTRGASEFPMAQFSKDKDVIQLSLGVDAISTLGVQAVMDHSNRPALQFVGRFGGTAITVTVPIAGIRELVNATEGVIEIKFDRQYLAAAVAKAEFGPVLKEYFNGKTVSQTPPLPGAKALTETDEGFATIGGHLLLACAAVHIPFSVTLAIKDLGGSVLKSTRTSEVSVQHSSTGDVEFSVFESVDEDFPDPGGVGTLDFTMDSRGECYILDTGKEAKILKIDYGNNLENHLAPGMSNIITDQRILEQFSANPLFFSALPFLTVASESPRPTVNVNPTTVHKAEVRGIHENPKFEHVGTNGAQSGGAAVLSMADFRNKKPKK